MIECFDQHRAHLRDDLSALDNVSECAEFILIDDARKHALSKASRLAPLFQNG